MLSISHQPADLFIPVLILALFCNCADCLVYSDGKLAVRWLDDGITSNTNLTTLEGLDCRIYDLRNETASGILAATGDPVYNAETMSLLGMIDLCVDIQSRPRQHELWKRSIFDIFKGIYPGTKWCGAGNIAKDITDLGVYSLTDSCCRDHDNLCDDHISPGERKYGIVNVYPFTISDCECDAKFRRCLQNAGTSTSQVVGTIYFSVARLPCLDRKPVFKRGTRVDVQAQLLLPKFYTQNSRRKSTFGDLLRWFTTLFGRK